MVCEYSVLALHFLGLAFAVQEIYRLRREDIDCVPE